MTATIEIRPINSQAAIEVRMAPPAGSPSNDQNVEICYNILGKNIRVVTINGEFTYYLDGSLIEDQTTIEWCAQVVSKATPENVQDSLAEAKAYTDEVATATLDSAKTYTDEQDTATLGASKAYTDQVATATLNSANAHSDLKDIATTTELKRYTDEVATATLGASKTYTDEVATATLGASKTYTDEVATATLDSANAHSDEQDTATLGASKTYTDQVATATLDSAKTYTDQVATATLGSAWSLNNSVDAGDNKTDPIHRVGKVAIGKTLHAGLATLEVGDSVLISTGTGATLSGRKTVAEPTKVTTSDVVAGEVVAITESTATDTSYKSDKIGTNWRWFTKTASGLLEKLTLLNNGNLGVGVSNPSSALDLSTPMSGAWTGVCKLLAPNNTGAGNASMFIFGVASSTGSAADWRYIYQGSGNAGNRVDFGFSGIPDPFITYTYGRFVGINNKTPAYAMDIVGGARVSVTPTITNASQMLVLDPTTKQISAQAVPTSSGSSVKRVVSIPSSTSITLDLATTDVGFQKNIQVAGTLTINAPSGTPVSEQRLEILLKSTNIQTLAWNAIFQGSSDLSLPTASTGTDKYDRLGFSWNADAGKWQLIAKVFGF